MSEFIKIETSPDFLKDFQIETPTEVIDNKQKEIEEIVKKQEQTQETVKSLEELKAELEVDDKEEESTEESSKEEPKKEEKQKEVETSTPEYSFKPFIEIMAEQGILNLEEGAEIGESAEDLVEVFENTVHSRITEGINEYKESVPEIGKQFLEYLENGGDPRKFIEVQSGPIDFSTLDLSDEANQKIVLKEYLKSQDYTSEEIKETLKDYEESLLLEKQAKVAVKKLEKIQEQYITQLVKEQEAEVEKQRQALDTYVKSVQSVIKESKEIAGLAITDGEKKDFENYLFKKDKAGLTQYQKDLSENPHKVQVELAYLKYKKYDFGKVAKKAESTAAAKIREKVLAKTETTVKGGNTDANPQSDNFAAFEKMFKNMRKQ